MLNAVLTPCRLLRSVWPAPLSLATTYGISVDFFSSSYLDVSVQTVPLIYLFIQYMMQGLDPLRISPFGYLRIVSCLLIPAAFRSLPRPSSAPDAKASFPRSFQLNLFFSELYGLISEELFLEIVFTLFTGYLLFLKFVSSLLFRYSIFKEPFFIIHTCHGLNDVFSFPILGGLNEDITSRPLGFQPECRLCSAKSNQPELSAVLVSSSVWWAEEDSNLRPLGYQPSALTS